MCIFPVSRACFFSVIVFYVSFWYKLMSVQFTLCARVFYVYVMRYIYHGQRFFFRLCLKYICMLLEKAEQFNWIEPYYVLYRVFYMFPYMFHIWPVVLLCCFFGTLSFRLKRNEKRSRIFAAFVKFVQWMKACSKWC